jgi:TonB family protein
MSVQFPLPLPFPLGLGKNEPEAVRACPRPARPTPTVDLAKYEDASRPIGELMAVWNGSVFGVKHFAQRKGDRSFHVGENPACDLWMPLDQLGGRDRVRLVRLAGDRIAVTLLPGATGMVRRADGSEVDVAELVRLQRAVPSPEIEGGHEIVLEPGERMHQDFGEFSFLANMVARPKLTLTRQREWTTPVFVAASLALHVAFLGIAWQVQSTQSGIAVDVSSGDNPYLQLMTMAPPQMIVNDDISLEEKQEQEQVEQEDKAVEDAVAEDTEEFDGGTGAKAAGDEGRAGTRDAPDVDKMMGVRGPRENPNPHMARTKIMEDVMESGVMSALAAIRSNAPTSMFSPYSTAMGNDPVDTRGHLMGSGYGDAYGNDGLGMFGTGNGGGGSNIYGFGLGEVGAMGHGYGNGDDVGIGRGDDGMTGRERGRCGADETCGMPELRGHRESGPTARILDAVTYGGLSKEAVRRVVQLNRSRIKHCYQVALMSAPELTGRVTVTFVVAPQGNVQSVQIAANSTQDGQLAQCVSTVVRRMAFPSADGVTGATYPFLFETTDAEE